MTRLKVAELTSGVGALVLGVGLGALFPSWFGRAAGFITFAGLFVHAFGMWDKHRLESLGQTKNPLRTEPPAVAIEIDARMADAWKLHPGDPRLDTRARRLLE